ncbi:hypothetical protein OQA88_6407 [Cercophora sp. LCS_1]
MGVASCLDLRYRLAVPDTPPETLTPDSSSFSARQSEERSWNPSAPLSPPMSNYDPLAKASDMSAGKGPDDGHVRKDVGADQAAPRQQLPPISSLFPSVRSPFNPPHLDRPGHYSASSPLDRPSGPLSALERTSSSPSYFPPVTTLPPFSQTQPRSAPESRFEERPQFPPLPRFPGPPSPRSREHEQRVTESRSDYSVGSWTSRHESSRDYPYSREPRSYRSPSDRYPGPLSASSRDEDLRGSLREQPSTHSLPKTPDSVAEAIPVKDGLGPKIWTGTHFLPRFVTAKEVPGEGMCYFYDDGSHCKTVIDGEAVNAHWGVTKAGKPRKRLAIACVTCREKKIKCDPDYPRCVQCEKFGRVCTFKNAPRGGHNTSPSTPPAEPEDVRRLGGIIRPPLDHIRPSSHSGEPISPRPSFRPASPDLPGPIPPKRIRVGYDHYTPTTGPRSPMAPTPDTARPTLSWHQPELPRIRDDAALCHAWQTDPYVTDPQSVRTTVMLFFAHTDAAALRFLPEHAFTSWVQNGAHTKSPEDLMLTYSILAAGTALSGGSRSTALEYGRVAQYAVDRSALSLQLVQSRMVLSLVFLALSRPGDANDMLSGAISAAIRLQLNIGPERTRDATMAVFPYGLTRAGYSESRTRTFWACFILERLSGLFPTRGTMLNTEDVFIRLPADLPSFEDQIAVVTPMFEPHFSSRGQDRSRTGIMGYLVEVVAVWGDVIASIYRLSQRGAYYGFDFDQFCRTTMSRLDNWKSSLPSAFEFSPTTLSKIAKEDQGTLVLMHLVFHLSVVKLHRHAYPQASISRVQYALVSQEHAYKLLEVVCAVAKDKSVGRTNMPPQLTSFAVLEAIDVLSADGDLRDLPRLVDALAVAHSVVEVLGTVWDDARVHQTAMDPRLDKLVRLRERGLSYEKVVQGAQIPRIQGLRVYLHGDDGSSGRNIGRSLRWQSPGALETRFPPEMDSVYSALLGAAAHV